MAIISRPIGYGALAVLVAGVMWWLNDEPVKVSRPRPKTTLVAQAKQQKWDFPAELTSLHFDKPDRPTRNIFKPLIAIEKVVTVTDPSELMKVPASLASGESDWTYTGMVEVNGIRMALLENATTHVGGYVKEGETWKKSRIEHITSANLVVVGPDGNEETVYRFNANQTPKPKPPPDGGFHPMDLGPALKGMIGPNVEIVHDGSSKNSPAPMIRGEK